MRNRAFHELTLPHLPHSALFSFHMLLTLHSDKNDDVSFQSWYSNTHIHNSWYMAKKETRQRESENVTQYRLENRWRHLPFKLLDNTCHLHDYETYIISTVSFHKQNVLPSDVRQHVHPWSQCQADHFLWVTFRSTTKHHKKNNWRKPAAKHFEKQFFIMPPCLKIS